MKFGIFYEHQLPRPWAEGAELQLYQDALDQVALADRLGIDYAWEVEHHFLEEYSHSPAPEVFLGACSQRTTRIRLGHGIVLMPPPYNHPARVAARIATLDLVSNGRVEFGTGESASRMELEGFGIDPAEKHAMWLEATEQVANLLAMDPYPGFSGKYFSMPCRNLVPKPVQKPHPPMWLACSSRDAIRCAARLGLGALTFAFVDPDDARHWVTDYYDTFTRECVPIGWSVNPNIAMVTGFSCHDDAEGVEHHVLLGPFDRHRIEGHANQSARNRFHPAPSRGAQSRHESFPQKPATPSSAARGRARQPPRSPAPVMVASGRPYAGTPGIAAAGNAARYRLRRSAASMAGDRRWRLARSRSGSRAVNSGSTRAANNSSDAQMCSWRLRPPC